MSVESLDEYIARLASAEPVPGGGSAATVAAALAAALVAMVARICTANPKYAAQAATAREIVARSDALRLMLIEARERDELAFGDVVDAQRLPKTTPHEEAARRQALEAALAAAAQAPLDAAASAVEILRLTQSVLTIPNRNLAGDAGCAGEFAAAAVAACAYNVRINHRYMRDAATVTQQSERLEASEREAQTLLADIRTAASQLQ